MSSSAGIVPSRSRTHVSERRPRPAHGRDCDLVRGDWRSRHRHRDCPGPRSNRPRRRQGRLSLQSRPRSTVAGWSRTQRSCWDPISPIRIAATSAAGSIAGHAIWPRAASPGTLTLLQTDEHFPRFSGRAGDDDGHRGPHQRVHAAQHERPAAADGQPGDDCDRIVSALARRSVSGNGRRPAKGGGAAAIQDTQPGGGPDERREAVFDARCRICHGADGEGLLASADRTQGLLVPAAMGIRLFQQRRRSCTACSRPRVSSRPGCLSASRR